LFFFFKKPNSLRFWGFLGFTWGFGLYWVFTGFFGFFYSNKQLGSLLVGLAHRLSFYLDSASTSDYLKIRTFITYWLLQAVNIKKEVFNYYILT